MGICSECSINKKCLFIRGKFEYQEGSPFSKISDDTYRKLENLCHHTKEKKCLNCATDDEINKSMEKCKLKNGGVGDLCINCSTYGTMKCNEKISDYI